MKSEDVAKTAFAMAAHQPVLFRWGRTASSIASISRSRYRTGPGRARAPGARAAEGARAAGEVPIHPHAGFERLR